MARALSRDARLIIMDEPSAVLDAGEVERLFEVIRDLTAEGVAVIYISHRLEEIRAIGDRVTVLKDGRTVATGLTAKETPTRRGHPAHDRPHHRVRLPASARACPTANPCSRVSGLGRTGEFSDVSFEVRPGEVVGFAGLVGAGRSEVLETVFGARKADRGSVEVAGRRLRPGSVVVGRRRRRRPRPGGAQEPGAAARRLRGHQHQPGQPRELRPGRLPRLATPRTAPPEEQVTSLDVRPAGTRREMRTLSGGNQQKVVLARWLLRGCRVLLLDEPTRGVDVGARSEIYALVRRLADQGVAVVVVSSEIEEVLGLADRVLVIGDGAVLRRGPGHRTDRARRARHHHERRRGMSIDAATTPEPAGDALGTPGRPRPPADRGGEPARVAWPGCSPAPSAATWVWSSPWCSSASWASPRLVTGSARSTTP